MGKKPDYLHREAVLRQQRSHGLDVGELRHVGQHQALARSACRRPSAAGRRSWPRQLGFRPTAAGRRGYEFCPFDLHPRQRDAALAHVFAGLVGIAGLARLVALQEQELADPLVRVDLRRQRRGVADLDRHLAFPFGLQRGDVHDDAAAGIGGLAQADHQHVARDAEIFDGVGQREAVGRDHADVGLAVDEAGRLERPSGRSTAELILVKILNSSAMRAS